MVANGRPFLLFDLGEGVLTGRPTDFNGTGWDASLETFLTNLEGGGVLAEKVRKGITKKTEKRKGGGVSRLTH